MTAPTLPRPVEDLLPAARKLASNLGGIPPRNRLMTELRVGAPKAGELRARLFAEQKQRRSEARRKLREVSRRGRQTRSARPLRAGYGPDLPMPVLPAAEVEPMIETPQVIPGPDPLPAPEPEQARTESERPVVTWPALLVALPAAVAIWAGWVAIGRLTGFGPVNLLPGFGGGFTIDTAITLPVGVEAYAGYAFYVALHPGAPRRARAFAGWSAGLAVLLGMGGQTAYHLMSAAGMRHAPWEITTVVSCLPVAVFGLVAALIHMVRAGGER